MVGEKKSKIVKTNKTVFFVGEHLLSFPGGAERSMHTILENLNELASSHSSSSSTRVKAITFDTLEPKVQPTFPLTNYPFPVKPPGFLFRLGSLYILNRGFIERKLSSHLEELKNCDYVITQSIIAPIVIAFCHQHGIATKYYLRDEYQLNIIRNYERGLKRFFKSVYMLCESISMHLYKKQNTIAMSQATEIVVNSKFMRTEVKRRFGKRSTVVLPKITKLKIPKGKAKKYILFVGGGDERKGFSFVEKLAKQVSHQFLIIGPYPKLQTVGNVTYHPMTSQIQNLYAQAKLVVVPSVCNETYGRVAKEANLLGIPTITSNNGGLPEANLAGAVMSEFDVTAWVNKIEEMLRK